MKEYQEFNRINTLPHRAYYIPFAVGDNVGEKFGIVDRTSSSLFQSLDGIWQIKELKRVSDFVIDEELTTEIAVPSCVQMNGFDHLQYINTRTPFPAFPPFVPYENPCYHYRRKFSLKKESGKVYNINFEGVDSAFYLYVNGEYIGYSQISHSTSEFDITKQLKSGENTIDVLVLKWCVSSYLEVQDKFRFTGIFRSVYILKRSKNHITDYKVETKGNGLTFINKSNVDITLSFLGRKIVVAKKEQHFIGNLDVQFWSSEKPILYDLKLESNDEVIYEKVGFRDIQIDGRVFKISGRSVKLRGVNRHEFNMLTGATVTLQNTYDDLMLMKELNVNAIRTSHYPDIPEFYQLCDVLGFYVIDEADLEMHEGATCEGGYTDSAWMSFVDNPIFEDGICEREKALLERDKNRPCVVIWSMGNESSYSKYFRKGNKYLRSNDSRPIHYEGMNHAKSFYYSTDFDFVSDMYPSMEHMHQVLDDKKETRPYILCEYSHSMGNSNGDLKEYWDLINNDERICGAFIWEWADHGILTEDGFKYGGDFGESEHDGNFCIDGIVTPDRKLKPGTLEMKAVYSGKTSYDEPNAEAPKMVESKKTIKPEYNYETGELVKLFANGNNVLARPIHFNILKYIDNEMYDKYRIETLKLSTAKPFVTKHFETETKVTFNCALVSNCVKPLVYYTICYEVVGGHLEISLEYKKSEFLGLSLPRVGIELALNGEYNNFEFVGYGPHESYIDRHVSNSYGLFKGNANDNYYHYIMPQESGSHYHSKYVGIDDLLKVVADKPFSFSYNPYSTQELFNKKHDFELTNDGNLYLCLDVAMSGVGTHSCGPELKQEYRVADVGANVFKLYF